MKTMFFKSVAVLLFSVALIQTTDAHDRDFGRENDKRFEKRENDHRYDRRENNRYFAYNTVYRRGCEREIPRGHYVTDRCGRRVFVSDCR